MRQGKVEKANALSTKIGAKIIAFNSGCLKIENKQAGQKGIWQAVRDATGKNPPQRSYTCATATSLNTHYATISTDPAYCQPTVKLTCQPQSYWPSEFLVFHA